MSKQLVDIRLKLMLDARNIKDAENKIIKLLELESVVIDKHILTVREIGNCANCNIELTMKVKNISKFCSDWCRSAFNNARYKQIKINKQENNYER